MKGRIVLNTRAMDWPMLVVGIVLIILTAMLFSPAVLESPTILAVKDWLVPDSCYNDAALARLKPDVLYRCEAMGDGVRRWVEVVEE